MMVLDALGVGAPPLEGGDRFVEPAVVGEAAGEHDAAFGHERR